MTRPNRILQNSARSFYVHVRTYIRIFLVFPRTVLVNQILSLESRNILLQKKRNLYYEVKNYLNIPRSAFHDFNQDTCQR